MTAVAKTLRFCWWAFGTALACSFASGVFPHAPILTLTVFVVMVKSGLKHRQQRHEQSEMYGKPR